MSQAFYPMEGLFERRKWAKDVCASESHGLSCYMLYTSPRRAAQTKRNSPRYVSQPGKGSSKTQCSVSEVCTAFQEMAWIGFNSILACLDSVTSSSGLSSFLCWELFCFHSHLTCLTSLFKTHLCDCMQSREVKFQIPLLYNQGE